MSGDGIADLNEPHFKKNGNFFEAFYTSETSIKYAIKKGIYFG